MSDRPSSDSGTRRTGREPRDGASGAPIQLEDLKAYLRAHPGALDDDGELVALLTPPAYHRGNNVLDMQSFVIARLKSQAVERAAREVKIKKALVADTLEERRLQKAVLAISSARNFEQTIDAITHKLPELIAATSIALNIERPERPERGIDDLRLARPGTSGPIRILPPGAVDRLLRTEEATLGTTPMGEAPSFGLERPHLRSFVAVRLSFGPATPPGLLAIGSKSAQRFGRGTVLHRYVFLARIIEQSIRLWLDLPPG